MAEGEYFLKAVAALARGGEKFQNKKGGLSRQKSAAAFVFDTV